MNYRITSLIPNSFKRMKCRNSTNSIKTRQGNHVCTDRYRTTFSSKLPKHSFTKIWNECEENIKLAKSKTAAKKQIIRPSINRYNDKV